MLVNYSHILHDLFCETSLVQKNVTTNKLERFLPVEEIYVTTYDMITRKI